MTSGMDRWTGRVAIVTGAGSGIGAAIARLLSENGMTVVGVDCDLQGVKALAAELQAAEAKGVLHAVQGDVTKEEDVMRVVKWARDTLGGADVLVNNAGVYYMINFVEPNTELMRKLLDVNVLGLCMFTREVIKDMRDRSVDDGHIFNMCSVSGHQVPPSQLMHFYSASKHAVKVMTEGLRRELRDLNTKIRVTNLSPGVVRTGLLAASGVPSATVDRLYARMVHLQPSDVAKAMLFALAAPPHVQIHEITIQAIGEL